MGFLSVLTLLFIGLKLADFIFWPWFWVMSPLIIELIFTIAAVCIVFCSARRNYVRVFNGV